MKNFNILGVHWKIWLLRGGSQERREGAVFEEGACDPIAHYDCQIDP